MNIYKKTQMLFDNSKLGILLKEKENIWNIIYKKLVKMHYAMGAIHMLCITCIALAAINNISQKLLFIYSCGGLSIFIVLCLNPFVTDKIQDYFKNKYGYNYKKSEIKEQLSNIEVQKSLFNYFQTMIQKDKTYFKTIEKIKNLLIEEKYESAIIEIEWILPKLKELSEIKSNDKLQQIEQEHYDKILKHEKAIGWGVKTPDSKEIEHDLKSIL